jgi:23S rRNA (guanosine2251-2'-O)-methyltransferase
LAGIHPVREALRAARPLDRVLIARGAGGPRLQEIIDLARQRAVSVRFEPREALDRASNGAAHQGVVAFGAAQRYADLDDVLSGTEAQTQLLVLLDGVEDPHNLGAIVRTAHAAGASAILIPDRRAAGLTEVVAKAAAGALKKRGSDQIGASISPIRRRQIARRLQIGRTSAGSRTPKLRPKESYTRHMSKLMP